jgi:hypothetical protein
VMGRGVASRSGLGTGCTELGARSAAQAWLGCRGLARLPVPRRPDLTQRPCTPGSSIAPTSACRAADGQSLPRSMASPAHRWTNGRGFLPGFRRRSMVRKHETRPARVAAAAYRPSRKLHGPTGTPSFYHCNHAVSKAKATRSSVETLKQIKKERL